MLKVMAAEKAKRELETRVRTLEEMLPTSPKPQNSASNLTSQETNVSEFFRRAVSKMQRTISISPFT